MIYDGNYMISGNQLTLQYSDGETAVYTLVIFSDGITLDDVTYYYSGEECS